MYIGIHNKVYHEINHEYLQKFHNREANVYNKWFYAYMLIHVLVKLLSQLD